jgi:hypothetical protein
MNSHEATKSLEEEFIAKKGTTVSLNDTVNTAAGKSVQETHSMNNDSSGKSKFTPEIPPINGQGRDRDDGSKKTIPEPFLSPHPRLLPFYLPFATRILTTLVYVIRFQRPYQSYIANTKCLFFHAPILSDF